MSSGCRESLEGEQRLQGREEKGGGLGLPRRRCRKRGRRRAASSMFMSQQSGGCNQVLDNKESGSTRCSTISCGGKLSMTWPKPESTMAQNSRLVVQGGNLRGIGNMGGDLRQFKDRG